MTGVLGAQQGLPELGISEFIGGQPGQVNNGGETSPAPAPSPAATAPANPVNNLINSAVKPTTPAGFDPKVFQGNNVEGMFWDSGEQRYKPTGGSGGSNQISALLDENYNKGISLLEAEQARLTQRRQQLEAIAKSGYDLQSEKLTNAKAESEQMLVNEGRKVADQREAAFNRAATTYSSAKQGAQALYGGQGIGQLFQALIARELIKTQGQIDTAAFGQDEALRQEAIKTNKYYLEMDRQIKLDLDTQLAQLEQSMQDALSQLEFKKFDLAQNKTNAKVNIIAQAQEMAQQITLMNEQKKIQLELWKEQAAATLANDLVARQQSMYNVPEDYQAGSVFNNPWGSPAASASTLDPALLRRYASTDKEDEFANL